MKSSLICTKSFSLIELLIVIGLLGALTMLVLPNLSVQKDWAYDGSIAPKEMMDIQKAFIAFEADCLPNTDDYKLIGKYGIEILVKFDEDVSSGKDWSFPSSFDSERAKGWRGPYLKQESTREIDINSPGQPYFSGSGYFIPVICDPRNNPESKSDRHYYRILYEETNNKMALVYVGADGTLDAQINPYPTGNDKFTDSFPESDYDDDTVKEIYVE
jgi:competence protein ComGC